MVKIKDVVNSNMCAGCGLCVGRIDDMQIDGDGFYRPKDLQNQEPIDLYCPGVSVSHLNADAPYELLWGPVISCEVGYAVDPSVRFKGSSGGVLTALLVYLLEHDLVDAVVQVGASELYPFRNETIVAQDIETIKSNAGSRYSPSAPLAVIRSLLGDGKRYAVVAKPCDISALRVYLNINPEYKNQFPMMLAFLCAGVPSEHGTRELLKALEISESELSSLRYRGDGWPGVTKATTKSGRTSQMTYNDSWGKILNQYLQPRCKLCADGIGEAADIVCGDAWIHSENGYPTFEECEGQSLTLARTTRGRRLLDAVVDSGDLVLHSYPINRLDQIQSYQKNRKQTILMRHLAIRLLGGTPPVFNGYMLFKNLIKAELIPILNAFMGTLSRQIKKRL